MFKAVILLALAAVSSAQILRISPHIFGSSTPGQQQVIHLTRGGGGGGYKQQQRQQNFAAIQPRAQPRPQQPRAQPQIQSIPSGGFSGFGGFGSQQSFAPQLQQQQEQQQQFSGPIQIAQIIPLGPIESFSQAPAPQANYALASPSRASYSQQSENEKPSPYAFAFDSEDEEGSKIGRQESSDGSGTITGQYTVVDAANGISRLVKYVADDNGFHADVQTNEPGTLTSNPADAIYQSTFGQK